MNTTDNLNLNPIEITDGVFWLGYAAENIGLHCNPYLIREGDEAVHEEGQPVAQARD